MNVDEAKAEESKSKGDKANDSADHADEHALPTGPIPSTMSGMKDAAKSAFKHQNYGFHLEEFKQVKQVPGLSLQNSVFGSTFYVMTGTHGTHVAIGVLWLFSMLIYSFTGRLTPRNAIDVEIAGLYWHFVDIVWIVIFTAVYLVEYI
ncbi:MAG: cytochrome c oxidase subunit 3 [Puniceicoccales bacterium]